MVLSRSTVEFAAKITNAAVSKIVAPAPDSRIGMLYTVISIVRVVEGPEVLSPAREILTPNLGVPSLALLASRSRQNVDEPDFALSERLNSYIKV
jgi:hypothetical protein